jgi:hypothetical protein
MATRVKGEVALARLRLLEVYKTMADGVDDGLGSVEDV